MNQLRPGTIAMLAGGVLLLISTFLDWFSIDEGFANFGENVLNGDGFGLTGIFVLLIALFVIAVTAVTAFAPQVNLPRQVLGFSMTQLVLILAEAVFFYAFSLMFRQYYSGIGTILAWIAAAVIVGGAFLELRAGEAAPAASNRPPQAF